MFDCLKSKEFTVGLHWLSVYIGIRGNEAADGAAKEAFVWRLKKIRRAKTTETEQEGPRRQPNSRSSLSLPKKKELNRTEQGRKSGIGELSEGRNSKAYCFSAETFFNRIKGFYENFAPWLPKCKQE